MADFLSVSSQSTVKKPSGRSAFEKRLALESLDLRREESTILQLNIGKLCNQACEHCHVNAGPGRKELMSRETVDRALAWFEAAKSIDVVDITGGAPEMNPQFRYLITSLRRIRPEVGIIDRCNLTILLEPGYEDMVNFLAENRVEITASLPCYELENVDRQRGDGVFEASIEALRRLNAAGYGKDSQLLLNLVYNPIGAVLPPDQKELELAYKAALKSNFGIIFNRLFTITNMPIARFLSQLQREGKQEAYEHLLEDRFNSGAVENLMCRNTLSVDWLGRVFDCDFNQMIGLPLGGRKLRFLWDFDPDKPINESIALGNHCFGCTAGAGSSCSGALQ